MVEWALWEESNTIYVFQILICFIIIRKSNCIAVQKNAKEKETEEEYLETCPKGRVMQMVILNINNPDNQRKFAKALLDNS